MWSGARNYRTDPIIYTSGGKVLAEAFMSDPAKGAYLTASALTRREVAELVAALTVWLEATA